MDGQQKENNYISEEGAGGERRKWNLKYEFTIITSIDQQMKYEKVLLKHTDHISGKRVCMPSQLYTFSTASQNFPQDGIAAAPPRNVQ